MASVNCRPVQRGFTHSLSVISAETSRRKRYRKLLLQVNKLQN